MNFGFQINSDIYPARVRTNRKNFNSQKIGSYSQENTFSEGLT